MSKAVSELFSVIWRFVFGTGTEESQCVNRREVTLYRWWDVGTAGTLQSKNYLTLNRGIASACQRKSLRVSHPSLSASFWNSLYQTNKSCITLPWWEPGGYTSCPRSPHRHSRAVFLHKKSLVIFLLPISLPLTVLSVCMFTWWRGNSSKIRTSSCLVWLKRRSFLTFCVSWFSLPCFKRNVHNLSPVDYFSATHWPACTNIMNPRIN